MSDEPEVGFSPMDERIAVPEGTTLLDAAEAAGISVEALCGGQGMCGTCKMLVDEGEACLSPPGEADEFVLSSDQRADGYRLSCRAEVECGPVRATVPSSTQNTGGIVLTDGQEMAFDLDPAVRRYHLELPAPTLEDNVADRERVRQGLAATYDLAVEAFDHPTLRELPNDLRAGEVDDGDVLDVTVTVYDGREVIDVAPGLHESAYGLAIDVGTTTLAVYLVDLRTGETEAVSSRLNPQSDFGGDLMTRVRHTRRNEDGRAALQAAIRDGVNECIDEVTAEAGVDADEIFEAVFVGNTAMHHLFLGIEPSYVAGSPYVAANHAPVAVRARDLDVDIHPGGYCYWLPISGGWVGPDKVSVLLVSGHHDEPETTVCIDIGTNGEISVGNAERTWVTSAPAGPALEGAEITHGLRAQRGAIETVDVDLDTGDPTLGTIGDAAPNGICGTGVIDALAGLFEAGLVDRRGQFRDEAMDHPRVRHDEDDVVEYVLAFDEETAIRGDVVLTQNDIRDVQMAKAAIQAGTLVLLDELDVEEVERVVLAGGFGNYIDPESAMTIGLYPDVGLERVESLGNAAGIGAKLALLDRERRAEAERIVEEIEYYEIAGTDVFRDTFLASMYLPHQDFDAYPNVRERIESIRSVDDVRTMDD